MQDCTGSGILPAGKDLCYEGQLLVETFKVKVLDNDGSSGSLNMQAPLIVEEKCCTGSLKNGEGCSRV